MESIQTRVLTRPRPLRTAYFIPLSEESHPILDAIFSRTHTMWGGRFSLIIPCVDGIPSVAYWPWLKTFDPDVIYSYVQLTDAQQASIHEEIYPSELRLHADGLDPQNPRYDPDLPVAPLSVSTVLPFAAMPTFLDQKRGIRVVGTMGRTENDRFLMDSFGSNFHIKNLLRARLASFGSSLLVIDDADHLPRHAFVDQSETVVPDSTSLLRMMADNPRDRGLAQLSAANCPRLVLDDRVWASSFNLVIGSTVADRLMFWNARFFSAGYRDGQDVDLCIPPKCLRDEAFTAALGAFLTRRNFVNEGYGNGPNRVTMRSISLTGDELDALLPRLLGAVPHQSFTKEHIGAIDACVPNVRALEYANIAVGQHTFRPPSLWKESYASGPELRLIPPYPEHMRLVPPEQVDAALGAWAVDLDIERSTDHSPYSNVRHRWRLPRRLRVTRAFTLHYQLNEPNGQVIGPRVDSGGLLTVFAVPDAALPSITLPTDYDAIRIALEKGRDWTPADGRGRWDQLPQLCYAAQRSDAGQHFFGVFQMFGDLNAARSVILHRFWRDQLARLGATDQRAHQRHDVVLRHIERRMKKAPLNLAESQQRITLANIVLQAADAERLNTPSRSWTGLLEDFEALVANFNAENPLPDQPERDKIEEKRITEHGLRRHVQLLCKLGVLHQGYEIKCSKCLHRNWIALGDLNPSIICQVCHNSTRAPVDQPWQFQLNGFLREALRRHGIGPLFWVLSRYQQHNRGSFWFTGPINIFFDENSYQKRMPETDIDLTMVDQGQVIMCEVKQSERVFEKPLAFAEAVKKLRPDVALVAVMEPSSPALEAKYEQFRNALAGTGIEPKLMTLNEDEDISNEPWF